MVDQEVSVLAVGLLHVGKVVQDSVDVAADFPSIVSALMNTGITAPVFSENGR